MKKIILTAISAILILSLFSCGAGKGPDDSVLIEDFSSLLEASFEINDIFFGEGLPTYSREEYKEAYQMTDGADPDYDFVVEESEYDSISDIKEAAEAVYTSDYLLGIYPIMFDGYYSGDDSHIAARYADTVHGFAKHNKTDPLINEAREYKLETAKVVMKNDFYATIEVETICAGKSETVSITLKNQDGTWLLDDPTY